MLDFEDLTWTCMVCGEDRPDDKIAVAYRTIPGMEDLFPAGRFNVRYCTDRPPCVAVANEAGPWPWRPALAT